MLWPQGHYFATSWPFHHVLNEWGFGVDIGGVEEVLRRQFPLQLLVLRGRIGMGTQVVPKQETVLPFIAPHYVDVQPISVPGYIIP